MTNKNKLEILGVILAIAGVLAGFVVYGMQLCNERSDLFSEISIEIENEEHLLEKYRDNLTIIKIKKENALTHLSGIKKYWSQNRDYMSDIDLYLKVDQYKAMASRSIRNMGGREVNLFERDIPIWKGILRSEGFVLGAPIREIMSLISTSSLTVSMPVEVILSQPSDAGRFIDSLSAWQNNNDTKYNKFFERLIYAFGLEHPKAGKDLDIYLSSKLTEAQGQILNIENDIYEIEGKILTANNSITKLKRRLDSIEAPYFCKLL